MLHAVIFYFFFLFLVVTTVSPEIAIIVRLATGTPVCGLTASSIDFGSVVVPAISTVTLLPSEVLLISDAILLQPEAPLPPSIFGSSVLFVVVVVVCCSILIDG